MFFDAIPVSSEGRAPNDIGHQTVGEPVARLSDFIPTCFVDHSIVSQVRAQCRVKNASTTEYSVSECELA